MFTRTAEEVRMSSDHNDVSNEDEEDLPDWKPWDGTWSWLDVLCLLGNAGLWAISLWMMAEKCREGFTPSPGRT